ncbi:MAG: Modification methylase MthZI [Promethearchaeota archaeon]|nr:MAG: Modification methylase MthZI [Candidatus Lokiarchaeota archaeon]
MKTEHSVFFKNSADMDEISSESIDLIVTSPPYPMIEMWDEIFISENTEIKKLIEEQNGFKAFKLMHQELNKIWGECSRVIKKGGIICINIGDATRKIGNIFRLYPNHVEIANYFHENGYIVLPSILWRKPTNSPTKFMGSGMIPSNAYITLEHEYILIFRKGKKKRKFQPKSQKRYNSAYFWEERNRWFSDIWSDIKGESQSLENYNNLRERSAAFPIELPYRLINMFSIYGDNILDPFWGTGTTSIAAMISARNSYGYEKISDFSEVFNNNIKNIKEITRTINLSRLTNHISFVKKYIKEKEIKYSSIKYKFPVVTTQEKNFLLYSIDNVQKSGNSYKINHREYEYEYEYEVENRKKLIQSRLIP